MFVCHYVSWKKKILIRIHFNCLSQRKNEDFFFAIKCSLYLGPFLVVIHSFLRNITKMICWCNCHFLFFFKMPVQFPLSIKRQIVNILANHIKICSICDDTIFNPLSPNSEQQQFSPNDIHTLSWDEVMRINKMIT